MNDKFLIRDNIINKFDSNEIWSKTLKIEQVFDILNKLEFELSKYDYEKDEEFIIDGRRSGLKSQIIDRLNNNQSDEAVLESLFNLWEYINNEYISNPLLVSDEFKISPNKVLEMWDNYKNKGIICLEEKNEILEMISYIKKYILDNYNIS